MKVPTRAELERRTQRALKYPVKLGVHGLFPENTIVHLATAEEMESVFPGWGNTPRPDEGSYYVGVWFPCMPHPTVVMTGQLIKP